MDIMTETPDVVQITDTDLGRHFDVGYDPFVYGQLDALEERACVPEAYWARRVDKVLYCLGYADVAGPNDTTKFFTDSLEDEADYNRRIEREF